MPPRPFKSIAVEELPRPSGISPGALVPEGRQYWVSRLVLDALAATLLHTNGVRRSIHHSIILILHWKSLGYSKPTTWYWVRGQVAVLPGVANVQPC
jgi:hypothetical protein